MNKFRIRRPSPALAVSIVALVVAAAGTSYAASAVPPNSVGTAQLKNNAVTNPKIANGAVTGPKIKLSTVGTVRSAASAQPAAFAHVSSTGVIDAANSKHPGKVTLETPINGDLYCFKNLPFTPKGGQVTVDGNDSRAQDGAQFSLGDPSPCPTGTQAAVYTWDAFSGAQTDGFFVVFYH